MDEINLFDCFELHCLYFFLRAPTITHITSVYEGEMVKERSLTLCPSITLVPYGDVG